METGQDDNHDGHGKSNILTEEITKYGRVSLLFYIPETIKDRDTMVELIKQNGGNIVKFHECFTYQIGTPGNVSEKDYYPGTVYSFQWIVESVEAKQLQEQSKYILHNFQTGLEFPFNKKKILYTIREIIIIYSWISGRKSQASRKTWENLGNDGILYCRSRESLKNFWKKWRNSSLEECLNEMGEKDTRYCHNYSEVVRPHEEVADLKRNKSKRTKENQENDEELIGRDENNPLADKQQMKRKVMKKKVSSQPDGDRINKGDHKSQKIEEVKEVEGVHFDDDDDQEEDIDIKLDEDEDEIVNDKEDQKESKDWNSDKPLEVNSKDAEIEEGSQENSNLGFPSLEANSENGEDE